MQVVVRYGALTLQQSGRNAGGSAVWSRNITAVGT